MNDLKVLIWSLSENTVHIVSLHRDVKTESSLDITLKCAHEFNIEPSTAEFSLTTGGELSITAGTVS